ncbi:MAG: hypothetical protein AB1427_17115 [Thermodesulfobacteriota bacterium]
MIHLSVFMLSLSSISFEILLARIFSISQWNHLSFMVISIALFGFAASGVVSQLVDIYQKLKLTRWSSDRAISLCIILYAVSVVLSLLGLNRIPLDYFRLTLEAAQIGYLLLSYVLASLPFFFTGLVVFIAYASAPQQSGIVYFVSMAGSALGAVAPAMLLPFWSEGFLVVFAGTAPLFVFLPAALKTIWRILFGRRRSSNEKFVLLAFGVCMSGISALLFTPGGNSLVSIRPSPYKALSQALQFPDTRIRETRTGIHGRIDHVNSRFFRFAPGLSLKFQGRLPPQSALFKDGDSPFALYHLYSSKDADFVKYTIGYVGYELNPIDEKVLIIQAGGGMGILCAIASGKQDIRVVEQDPHIADLVRRNYNLTVINQNHRAYLGQVQQRFGIIQIENWGNSLPGSAALNQEYFFTVEAITSYLEHLTENGVVIVARKLLLPPADDLRIWAAAYESLRASGAQKPEMHLAVLRNWDTVVFIISARPFTGTKPIEDFALNKNFDMVYIPGIREDMANRFSIFEQPYHYLEIRRLAEAYQTGKEKGFFASYPLDIAPQTDQRPFQSSFLKWARLDEFYKSTGSRFDALFISGEMVAAAVLIEAIAIALALLLLPRMIAPKNSHGAPIMQTLYFLLIGAGFMLVEIYFIKVFVFLYVNPIISLTVVLSGILVYSGVGGYFSRNMGPKRLKYGMTALMLTLAGLLLGMDHLTHWSLSLPDYGRYGLVFFLLLAPSILMGMPFSVGIRLLPQNSYQRANAWAINGCASVISAIVAVQIALGMGLPAILACAILAYSGAYIIMVLNPAVAIKHNKA